MRERHLHTCHFPRVTTPEDVGGRRGVGAGGKRAEAPKRLCLVVLQLVIHAQPLLTEDGPENSTRSDLLVSVVLCVAIQMFCALHVMRVSCNPFALIVGLAL